MTGNKIIFAARNIFSREYLGSSKNNYFLLKLDESGKKRLFRLFAAKKHFFDRFSEIVGCKEINFLNYSERILKIKTNDWELFLLRCSFVHKQKSPRKPRCKIIYFWLGNALCFRCVIEGVCAVKLTFSTDEKWFWLGIPKALFRQKSDLQKVQSQTEI